LFVSQTWQLRKFLRCVHQWDGSMALLQFHFLVTCFGLTIWTHAPGLVLALTYAFQAVCYIADIEVLDYDEYIWWTFLTALAGVLLGWALLIVTRAPLMLRFETSYVGVWGQFVLWLVFYLAAQLFYGFYPPPAYPWGIIGTTVCHLIIQVALWVVMYYNSVLFALYTKQGRKYFFGLWTLVLFAVEVSFFIAYALLERWTAYIATGIGAAILLVMALVFPLKKPYRDASAFRGEPLVNRGQDSDEDEEGDIKAQPLLSTTPATGSK